MGIYLSSHPTSGDVRVFPSDLKSFLLNAKWATFKLPDWKLCICDSIMCNVLEVHICTDFNISVITHSSSLCNSSMSLWSSISSVVTVFLKKINKNTKCRSDTMQILGHAFQPGQASNCAPLQSGWFDHTPRQLTVVHYSLFAPLRETSLLEKVILSQGCVEIFFLPAGNASLFEGSVWCFTQRGWEFVHLENTDCVPDSASSRNLRIGYYTRDTIIDCVWETCD